MTKGRALAFVLPVVVAGCGSSEPVRAERPLTARPAPTGGITASSTPEEKIRYIQNSKAPDAEKEKAIAQIRAGTL